MLTQAHAYFIPIQNATDMAWATRVHQLKA